MCIRDRVMFCDMYQSIHPTFTLSIRMLKNIFDFRGDVLIRVSIKTETCDMGGVHFASFWLQFPCFADGDARELILSYLVLVTSG